MLNNSGLTQAFSQLQRALLMGVTRGILSGVPEQPERDAKQEDEFMLNSVGPAAAAAAVDHALTVLRNQGKYRDVQFNGSFINNVRLVQNNPVEAYPGFSGVLRQFLLPRYAYLNFDQMVDPRHNIDFECGYPKFITPIMYRYMYDRDDVACKVVDIYADESWAADPLVYEDERLDVETEFEEDWRRLCDDYNVMQYLYRIDRLAGIGHYGALLLGVDDGEDLEKPIDEPELLLGARNSVGKKKRNLLYMRPFDEYLSFIHMYETDVMHPRYGLPKFYNLVFLDMTIDAAGASIGTRLNRRVHWSRVVHVADNLMSSLVFGVPRMQQVFDRLLDLRKIKGGSAEMFWKGAFPGYSFEIDPQFVADDPEFDRKQFREEIDRYADGLSRYLALVGISAKSLAPQVADPHQHVRIQMEAIAARKGVPMKIWMGSEESRLASSEDKLTWNKRLNRNCKRYVEPSVIRNFIDRMIALGMMRPPRSGRYFVDWGDLNTATDEDKANLALKWTQALSQYVSSGVIHFIKPMDYLTMILGLKPADAKKVMDAINQDGGLQKLLKVDPSQGSGRNGVAENNVGKGSREGNSRARPVERDTADKSSEGMTS